MLKKILYIAVYIIAAANLQAQNSNYADVDAKVLRMPKNQTKNSMQIADWISENFTSETDRVRAAYIWVASNISYEANRTQEHRSYSNEYELVEYALKNHSGVCSHYSYLFCDILNKMGIKSYPIRGYVKNATVDDNSHQWSLAKVDGGWYFFDPTWGSGYLQNGKFIRHVNDASYMISPNKMIRTYMPFDPMFQLMDYPISYAQFDQDVFDGNRNGKYCNWRDSLAAYDDQNNLEQYEHARYRITHNGKSNSVVYKELSQINSNIEISLTNNSIDIYNTALAFYNNGISYLNELLTYRNNQYRPQRSEEAVRNIIHSGAANFNKAFSNLRRVNNEDADLHKSVNKLHKLLVDASNSLLEQKAFADRYYRTYPQYRRQLFYKRQYY